MPKFFAELSALLHPSPLRGGTEGGGLSVGHKTTPHPSPPPQGGREAQTATSVEGAGDV